MRIGGAILGGVTGPVLICVALFFGGVMGCCSGSAPATPFGIVARVLSTPGFALGAMLQSLGVPDFLALILGGAGPGAIVGLGLGEFFQGIADRRKHARS